MEKNTIKSQIIAALSHPEADEGLYLRNLHCLHEEDERPEVNGEEVEIVEALNELVREGKVVIDENHSEIIFRIAA